MQTLRLHAGLLYVEMRFIEVLHVASELLQTECASVLRILNSLVHAHYKLCVTYLKLIHSATLTSSATLPRYKQYDHTPYYTILYYIILYYTYLL